MYRYLAAAVAGNVSIYVWFCIVLHCGSMHDAFQNGVRIVIFLLLTAFFFVSTFMHAKKPNLKQQWLLDTRHWGANEKELNVTTVFNELIIRILCEQCTLCRAASFFPLSTF